MCDSLAKIDSFWSSLSAGSQPGPCGWLKDRYGLSWQVVPSALPQMLVEARGAARDRLIGAIMGMSKFDLEKLKQAGAG